MSAVVEVMVASASTVLSAGVIGVAAYLARHSKDHSETHTQLADNNERLARIEAEFQPNHGSSARDLQEDTLDALHYLIRAQGAEPPLRRSERQG